MIEDVNLQEPLTELTSNAVIDMDFSQTVMVTLGINRKPSILEGGYPNNQETAYADR